MKKNKDAHIFESQQKPLLSSSFDENIISAATSKSVLDLSNCSISEDEDDNYNDNNNNNHYDYDLDKDEDDLLLNKNQLEKEFRNHSNMNNNISELNDVFLAENKSSEILVDFLSGSPNSSKSTSTTPNPNPNEMLVDFLSTDDSASYKSFKSDQSKDDDSQLQPDQQQQLLIQQQQQEKRRQQELLEKKLKEEKKKNKETLLFKIPPPSSALIATMPGYQDRKCILGSLASILASFYHNEHHDNPKSFHHKLKHNARVQKDLKRRYTFFCELLEQSAQLMYLEKEHARAFFPMLHRLLHLQEAETEEGEFSTSSSMSMSSVSVSTAVSTSTSTKNSPSNLFKNIYKSQSSMASSTQSRHVSGLPPLVMSPSTSNANANASVSVNVDVDVNVDAPSQPLDLLDVFDADADTNTNDQAPPTSSSLHSTSTELEPELEPEPDIVNEPPPIAYLNELIQPFLESLTPGSGFLCITLLLSQYLLRSIRGYDARTRHALKKLSILVIVHEHQINLSEALSKFEAMEVYLAQKLLEHYEIQKRKAAAEQQTQGSGTSSTNNRNKNNNNGNGNGQAGKKKAVAKPRREAIMRGLKITSAGVLAGTLFGITGGLAAPGIAAGLAAFAGGTAAAATIVTLTSASAISVLFGVGGGGLAAYKIHRRTKGLTEFTFHKETQRHYLHCVICMTGWLRDKQDFQRPWGVTPKNPALSEKEKLERFYAKVNPEQVEKSATIANNWKGEVQELHKVLKSKYGLEPDNLWEHETTKYTLDGEEEGLILQLLEGLDVNIASKSVREIRGSTPKKTTTTTTSTTTTMYANSSNASLGTLQKQYPNATVDEIRCLNKLNLNESASVPTSKSNLSNLSNLSLSEQRKPKQKFAQSPSSSSLTSQHSSTSISNTANTANTLNTSNSKVRPPWSFTHRYSGEVYTVKFESMLLMELCDSVTDLAVEFVGTATKEILKQTAMHALMAAVALPVALISAANMIDGTWTLAIERAEEAGLELAKILTSKSAGCRPVTLVGYSMGARAIYMCLKELVRLQEEWTEDSDSREPASVVEDVIVMGLPNHLSLGSWAGIRRVVAGRVVNCFSSKDWILSLMFQYKRMTGLGRRVCGTSRVLVDGIENYDVTSLIQSHGDYCVAVEDILKLVEFGLPRDLVDQSKFEALNLKEEQEQQQQQQQQQNNEGGTQDTDKNSNFNNADVNNINIITAAASHDIKMEDAYDKYDDDDDVSSVIVDINVNPSVVEMSNR